MIINFTKSSRRSLTESQNVIGQGQLVVFAHLWPLCCLFIVHRTSSSTCRWLFSTLKSGLVLQKRYICNSRNVIK